MKTKLYLSAFLAIMISSSAGSGPLDAGLPLTLSLESVPIAKVLRMIADQNKLNLVLSDKVEGTISVHLDNVDVRTALDAILRANGYSYTLRDNIIIVKSAGTTDPDELSSIVIQLRYLEPSSAKKALESRKSPKGQIVILDQISDVTAKGSSTYHANRIVITDHPGVVQDLAAFVAAMDIPEQVVLIEVKILETKLDNSTKLGLLWPSSIGASLAGIKEASSSTETGATAGSTGSASSAATYELENGRWTWGTLSVGQMNAVLDFLDMSGNSKLISDPRISTVENHEAEIKISTVTPIQTINRFTEAASTQDIVTFQDFEVGISLKVTPRINGDGKITLDVEPKVEDIIGYAGTAPNQKPIKASRSVKTRITVGDGETAALGGLLKESTIKRTQRVPLLGSIPLLGKLLFTNTTDEKSTTDLVILLTPHILPQR